MIELLFGIHIVLCVAIIVQISMSEGGIGLFPIIYNDTVTDADLGWDYPIKEYKCDRRK